MLQVGAAALACTNTDKHRLGPRPLCMLTDFGQFGNLRCQGPQMVCMWNRNRHLWVPNTPIWSEKQAILCKKKRQRLNGLAWSHQCSVKTHDKPASSLHLASTTARIQAGVKKSYAAFPPIPYRLCVLFPYHKKGKSEKGGHRIPLKICRRKTIKRLFWPRSTQL